MILKPKRHQSRHLRDSARGQPCMVRIPGVCSFDSSTVVLAHMNGSGMGTKHSDLNGAFCCSRCHDAVDRRVRTEFSRDELNLMLLEGMVRTQGYWLDAGLVKLDGCDD